MASGSRSKGAPALPSPASLCSAPSPAVREMGRSGPGSKLLSCTAGDGGPSPHGSTRSAAPGQAPGLVGEGVLAPTEMALYEVGEGAGAVANPVLLLSVEFAKSQGSARRDKHRIVAETALAARRPDQASRNLAAEEFGPAIRPGEREQGDEHGVAVLVAELPVDPLHRNQEVL